MVGKVVRTLSRGCDAIEALNWPWHLLILATWSFIVHGAFLLGSPERSTPISFLFFGDSLQFLAHGRHLAEGLTFNEGLPFHPPLTAWLTVPLWWWLPASAVSLAAKLLMAVLSGAGMAAFFLLLRSRVEHAFWIVALLPLGFGELLLAASVNSELLYRLILLLTLLLAWRRPLLVGALQGLAALTRAEHLPFIVGLGLLIALLPDGWSAGLPSRARRRRFVAVAAVGASLLLLPYLLLNHSRLREYNRSHASQLVKPLPTWVPVSFYGPLNFALAQREADIYFSRRTLPPAPGGMSQLDPTFPPHQRTIVDGYRLGIEAIRANPGRFFHRLGRKVAVSVTVLSYGWSWRDLPHRPLWIRRPVDTALAKAEGAGRVVGYLVGLLALVGAWRLRGQRGWLAIGGLLIFYRLAINAAFFPYLRSMLIVSPFWSVLALSGAASLCGKYGRSVLVGGLLVLAAFHLSTAPRQRVYQLDGERDSAGHIIDDRTVEIRWVDAQDIPR